MLLVGVAPATSLILRSRGQMKGTAHPHHQQPEEAMGDPVAIGHQWSMTAGLSAVRKWLQITHSPTPTENPQAAPRRPRSRRTTTMQLPPWKRPRGSCTQCGPFRTQFGASRSPPLIHHNLPSPRPHLPQHWLRPGESQTQVRA